MSRPSIAVILSTSAATTGADASAFAEYFERLGLDGVFVGDHLAAYRPILESTLTLAMIAARTTRIHVGFGVMVVALRHPAWAAKQVATLQQLSGNRVILGVGSGGHAHGTAAWQAVGVPYAERGKRTDLLLDVLPRLIGGQAVRLDSGAEITLAPPAEVPPIWVGGGTAISLRRTIQYGDAWFPSMITPDDVAGGALRLCELGFRTRPACAVHRCWRKCAARVGCPFFRSRCPPRSAHPLRRTARKGQTPAHHWLSQASCRSTG